MKERNDNIKLSKILNDDHRVDPPKGIWDILKNGYYNRAKDDADKEIFMSIVKKFVAEKKNEIHEIGETSIFETKLFYEEKRRTLKEEYEYKTADKRKEEINKFLIDVDEAYQKRKLALENLTDDQDVKFKEITINRAFQMTVKASGNKYHCESDAQYIIDSALNI